MPLVIRFLASRADLVDIGILVIEGGLEELAAYDDDSQRDVGRGPMIYYIRTRTHN